MESTRGFVIENEWYWRIHENAQSFDAAAAARDFVAPLARFAKDRVAITDVVSDGDEVRFVLGETPVAIRVASGAHDRVAVNQFVGELNRAFAAAKLGLAFALVVPRRYELRGALVTDAELAALVGTPALLMPSGRPSARSLSMQSS